MLFIASHSILFKQKDVLFIILIRFVKQYYCIESDSLFCGRMFLVYRSGVPTTKGGAIGFSWIYGGNDKKPSL